MAVLLHMMWMGSHWVARKLCRSREGNFKSVSELSANPLREGDVSAPLGNKPSNAEARGTESSTWLQEDCVKELTRLVTEDGFRAVRFNPYLWPEGEKMTNGRGRAMYARCVPSTACWQLCFRCLLACHTFACLVLSNLQNIARLVAWKRVS